MCARLLDVAEFSKSNFDQIIQREEEMIKIIQQESGMLSEVRVLSDCLADVKASRDMEPEIKQGVVEILDKSLVINKDNVLGQLLMRKGQGKWVSDKCSYELPNPPSLLLPTINAVEQYFSYQQKHIRFDLTEGKSKLAGVFSNGKKQNFEFKNMYVMALLLLD